MNSNTILPAPMPPQPAQWPFLRDLLTPLHGAPIRFARHKPQAGEVSLAKGINLDIQFPDPAGLLETAHEDFKQFLKSASISMRGPYRMQIRKQGRLMPEAYVVEIARQTCVISASDTEGIRRALVWIEDEMLGREGPFLPQGRLSRKPVIRSRIQMEINLFHALGLGNYPDHYLNRLAHQGVNGLMVLFEAVYPYRIVPGFERPPETMFATLRERVRRYARYGIKVYLYCNEPKAFPAGSPLPKRYPSLAGHVTGPCTYYCTSSPQGRRFLEQSLARLFAQVPGLGGMIVICVGERPTHCYSAWGVKEIKPIICPRCAPRAPREVLRDALATMERGIHRGNPRAEFIAWPYSSYICWGERLTRDAADCFPPDVIMMHNFESAGVQRQLGAWQRADDYWLAYPGPSALFRDCALRARRHGTRMFAKLMVGCSHELASVPYIPAPGLVYAKYKAAQRLGITGVLANWGSGNDPSLMNKAAGELAFSPFPATEAQFLRQLARRDWGRHAVKVAAIWKQFSRAFRNCPLNIGFSYYGPLHNGPVWPLFLEPRDWPLAGNWRNEPHQGDRIGDCTGFQPLPDIITLCARLDREWRKGMRRFAALTPAARMHPERWEQIAVARALACHFESGLNIMRFYQQREILLKAGRNAMTSLRIMRKIVRDEIKIDRRLLVLAEEYPRLGFCPEAHGYKYFPALIRWRMRQLRRELAVEFPRVVRMLRSGRTLFPAATGEKPRGFVYACRRLPNAPNDRPFEGVWSDLPAAPLFYQPKASKRTTLWKAAIDGQAIYFAFQCREPDMQRLVARARDRGEMGGDDHILIVIQTSQFESFHRFFVNSCGAREYSYRRGLNVMPYGEGREWLRGMNRDKYYLWTARSFRSAEAWMLVVRIPFLSLGWKRFERRPIRISMARQAGPAEERELSLMQASVTKPWIERHPANFGWLRFE